MAECWVEMGELKPQFLSLFPADLRENLLVPQDGGGANQLGKRRHVKGFKQLGPAAFNRAETAVQLGRDSLVALRSVVKQVEHFLGSFVQHPVHPLQVLDDDLPVAFGFAPLHGPFQEVHQGGTLDVPRDVVKSAILQKPTRTLDGGKLLHDKHGVGNGTLPQFLDDLRHSGAGARITAEHDAARVQHARVDEGPQRVADADFVTEGAEFVAKLPQVL